MGMRRFIEFTAPATAGGLGKIAELTQEFDSKKKVEYICIEYPLDNEPQLLVRFVDGD